MFTTREETITIFKTRINDLSHIKGVDLTEIQDDALRAQALMTLRSLHLNERLLMEVCQPVKKLS